MPRPCVSVIMPVRNEVRHVHESLNAVLHQSYSSDRLEVIVVDGLSTDGTRSIIESMLEREASERFLRLKMIDNDGLTAAKGLNRGLSEAQGDVLVRVDGHCRIPLDYVERCVELLDFREAACVGGRLEARGEGKVGAAIARAQSHWFGVGNARFRRAGHAGGWVDTVAFGAYRKEVLQRIGSFDEELVRNQDDELNFRILQSGGRIWIDPSLVVSYFCRRHLRDLARQYFSYGFFKVRVVQKRGGFSSARQLAPPLLVTGLITGGVLAKLTRAHVWYLAIAGPYVVADAWSGVSSGCDGDWSMPLVLMAVFPVMHFSYGCGFLWGLWRWRRHWRIRGSKRP